MLCILLLQMSYSIAGELLHEILGITLFCLFALHHILSFPYTKALLNGRHSADKILRLIVDILLTADILTMMLSAVIVSKHLFTFLGISSFSDFGRTSHLLGAYWGFALMSVHLGFHLDFMLHRIMQNQLKKTAAYAIMFVLAAAGLVCFIHEGIYKYMLLINRFVFFDTTGGLPMFLIKYVPIMCMYAVIGYVIMSLTKSKKKG